MIVKSPTLDKVQIDIDAYCHTCKHRHKINVHPDEFGSAAMQWEYKHRGHDYEFLSPSRTIEKNFDDRVYEREGRGPWWLNYHPNMDFKVAYAADAAFTIDLSALGASSTWVTGRESASVSNTSDKYFDYLITGTYISGTSPTPGEARLYVIVPTDDTPTWSGGFDGTDSAATVTNTQILDRLPLSWSGGNSGTSNVTYPIIGCVSPATLYGLCPYTFLVFFVHSQVAALKTDANNTNKIFYKGMYLASV